jgi:PncC family amidohydrolase
MEPFINQTHKLLLKKRKTVSVAESCTGGLLSEALTRMPGSSAYFILGVVAYSNKTKQSLLRIPPSLIKTKGAVSKQVASLMAKNVRRIAHTHFSIGITGIAGPTGGTPKKPVGTVFIAVEGKKQKICKKFHFSGSRNTVRKKAALKASELLIKYI